MGLGAVVLSDLMKGEPRAHSSFQSVPGCEEVPAMPARLGRHTVLLWTRTDGTALLAHMNYT